MSRNAILIHASNVANLTKAETTIIAHLPGVLGTKVIPINGKDMPATQAVALIQSHLDKLVALDKLRAEVKAAIDDERTLRATVKAAVICIRNYVAAAFGEQSSQYASLGFEPRKRGVKPAEVKAKAVEKQLATRKARHTMGKVQKSKIFGTVPAAPTAAAPVSAAPVTNASASNTQSTGSIGATAAGASGNGTPSNGNGTPSNGNGTTH